MNTPNNNNTTTFAEFLSEHNVQIPIIQRDYVQGRAMTDNEKEKRDDFVKKLMCALLTGGMPYHLDFVYGGRESFGNSETISTDAPFLPLDGQQRLTTLFLLHWMLLQKNALAKGANEQEQLTFNQRMKGLAKFTYKTRISSGRFCQKLIELRAESDCSLTELIEKQYWYDHDMQSDPTVKAMMQMLSLMEAMLDTEPYRSQKLAMLTNLYDASEQRITFDILDMERYNLTDGLYVKMNARGKELTAFENWKASFINLIEQKYNIHAANTPFDLDDVQAFLGILDAKRKGMKERFSYSMEHEWNDVFWKIAYKDYKNCCEGGNDCVVSYPKIDDAFMHFFNNLTRLFFFTIPENQSFNANDYKAGLWSTVNDVYYKKHDDFKEMLESMLNTLHETAVAHDNLHPDFNEMLFDMLDALHEIDAANGSIHLFFAGLFATEAENGKVRLFDDNIDLFEATCSSDNFSANHILLFAILLYCTTYKTYVPDERLMNYVRCCRNYLYEHNYFDTGSVTVSPQIRVSEMAQYFRFFIALLLNADPLVSLEKLETKDEYALREKSKLGYYQNPKVLALVRWLEDLPYTYGNLSAFASVLEQCMADDTYCAKVKDAMEAFIQTPALTKVQLFVALGYRGIMTRNCAYGKAVFLGGEFGGISRWMVHFRKKYDSTSPLDAWMSRYVEAFAQQKDLNEIIAQHAPTDKYSVAYYMVKYPDMLASQVYWRNNYNRAPFYFAMKKPWANLDMITIHSISSRPLNNAYQVCPMANAVARRIGRYRKYNEAKRMGYAGRSADKNGILINESPKAWDKIAFSMRFGSDGWILPAETYNRLPSLLQQKLEPQDENNYMLRQTDDKDLIEVAVDFVDKVLDEFERTGLLR